MELQNKYYTPKLQEFHVGFEYQFNHKDKGWIDLKFGDTDDWSILEIDMEIENNEIRVKYLDQEGIESLGWEYSGTSIDKWYKLIKDCERPLSNFMNRSFRLQHDFKTNQGIVIHAYEYDNFSGAEEILYRGSCKNKSELKKLMQQLNIK